MIKSKVFTLKKVLFLYYTILHKVQALLLNEDYKEIYKTLQKK